MTFKQGTTLTAKQDFSFVNPQTKRTRIIRAGKSFWVANSEVNQKTSGAVEICGLSQSMGQGFHMSLSQVENWFTVQ